MELTVLKSDFEGKKVCIWGMGMEGKSTYQVLHTLFPETMFTCVDDQSLTLEGLDHATFQLTKDTDFSSFDLIMKSPGIPVDDPHFPFDKLTSQTEVFLRHFRDQTVAITGTKGKSTTTSLVYAFLQEAKIPSVLVGNIGIPCFSAIEKMTPETWAVFEISCHQLEFCRVSPHIGALLNLYEEHLDHYHTFEKYIQAKEHLFLYQKPGDVLLIEEGLKAQIAKAPFAITVGFDEHAQVRIGDSSFWYQGVEFVLTVNSTNLMGRHNFYNSVVAIFIAMNLFHIKEETIRKALKEFHPLEHRLEVVGTYQGIRYVNDSISTIPEATIAALKSLHDVDTVLIGGMDRGIDYQALEKYLKEVDIPHVILMYASGKRIYEESENPHYLLVDDLKEAIQVAQEITTKGKTCLLSPAAASYGYFLNFEERGRAFKNWVKA